MTAHAGVHEYQAVGMLNQVSQDGLDATGAGTRLLGWADEVAEIYASDGRIAHVPSLHR
jgi:hypothetical protein